MGARRPRERREYEEQQGQSPVDANGQLNIGGTGD